MSVKININIEADEVIETLKGFLTKCKCKNRCIELIKNDVKSIRERDPAARTDAEVLLLYPGLHAVIAHRIAHQLYREKMFFAARAVSQITRGITGIEIHPAARIGTGLFIDHGAAVVIGETTVIGNDCTIYQGATLGGTGKQNGKRHPTLGDRVMVGAGAKVLGALKIGDDVKIAAGAVVLKDVPAGCTAVGIPARIVGGKRTEGDQLDQVHIPDPIAQEIARLESRINELEGRLSNEE